MLCENVTSFRSLQGKGNATLGSNEGCPRRRSLRNQLIILRRETAESIALLHANIAPFSLRFALREVMTGCF